MKRYNPKEIEPKWQQKWAETKIYEVSDNMSAKAVAAVEAGVSGPEKNPIAGGVNEKANRPKRYVLEYFPYPSGAAMHVGHVRNYTIGDALSRHARMRGFDVLHPMGWDAFGLPAENYAIKTGISPRQAIDENTARFKKQLTQMGFGYDWSREIDSTDPNYYRWTQWFFLLLFKKGLAYQKESLQWWCPVDKTVLANEQVENGRCWRCGSEVEKKALKQWFFKITAYADRLEKDLDDVNWSSSIKHMQRNWIGRSVGAEIDFEVEASDKKLTVFTTRPDTLYGVTFIVVAPEHPIVKKITAPEHREHVGDYVKAAQSRSDVERQETYRTKTGVFTGAYAINPINNERMPVWVADYVLYGYGTGVIMAVPAHDERDAAFAEKFSLPKIQVIKPRGVMASVEQDGTVDFAGRAKSQATQLENEAYHGEGLMCNSGPYDDKPSEDVREQIVAEIQAKGFGKQRVSYKMRDWLISRQRYWGAPIPIIHCDKDGAVAVPEDQLPVLLPDMQSFEPRKSQSESSVDASGEASSQASIDTSPYAPSGDGHSPLARVADWVNTTCPKCGGPAKRETDTMDGFACSSWYFLRFADPHNNDRAFDPAKVKKWLPVDDYIGGAEHAVMHLLYARFWTKVMQDEGLIDFGEPFLTLRNQGMILAPDGQKMSKSKSNTIEPDGLIEQGYGADAIRIMELFIGPWNQSAAWSVEGMGGSFRFLQRVWTLAQEFMTAAGADPQMTQSAQNNTIETSLKQITHRTIKKVSQDLESLSFNTAIAAMMEAVNELYKVKTTLPPATALQTWRWTVESLVQLLAPFAPHITEELWAQLGHDDSIHVSAWPDYDEQFVASDNVTIAVQINGKVRTQLKLSKDAGEADVVAAARADVRIATHLAGKEPRKTIYVPGKILNLVV